MASVIMAMGLRCARVNATGILHSQYGCFVSYIFGGCNEIILVYIIVRGALRQTESDDLRDNQVVTTRPNAMNCFGISIAGPKSRMPFGETVCVRKM